MVFESRSVRWEVSPPGLDEQEIAWWQEFADIEDTYCWVHTPRIQRFLRGHYIEEIAASVPADGVALEFGCGAGWLPLRLLDLGASRVFGADFSPAQIELAKRHSIEQGYGNRVQFHLLDGSLSRLKATLPPINVLVLHGVLHHMTREEIRGVIDDFCRHLAAPEATVWILEPVLYPAVAAPSPLQRRMSRLIDRLTFLPLSGERSGIRRVGSAERAVRQELQRCQRGVPPRGPSPKEHSFLPGEIEELLSPYLHILSTTPAMCFLWHVVRNLLLLRLTYPRIGAAVMWPYMWFARIVERRVLKNLARYGTGGYGIFELKKCRVRSPGASVPARLA